MNKAQAVSSRALDQHVMHKIVAARAFFVVFFPVATNSDHLKGVFCKGNYVWTLNSGRFAVFVHVLEACEVQIDQLLEQKYLTNVICGLNTGNFVDCFLNLACISRRSVGIKEHIEVFAGQSTLSVLV